MQQFKFGLDRVLAWRRTQARLEDARLEALHTELRGIGAQAVEVAHERNTAGRGLLASGSATGVELALLDSFHKAADEKTSRLKTAQADCSRRIDAQIEAVTERRRDVKLLERLRERRVGTWQVESSREDEQESVEAHLARGTWRTL